MHALQQTLTDDIIDKLLGQHRLLNDCLSFSIGDFSIQVRSNSTILLERLAEYFSPFARPGHQTGIELLAIEGPAPELPLQFTDWQREAGKSGRKDSYADVAYCRLIRKVRTGMVFLQSADLRVASGPCLDNLNQLVNFINAQYMNWLQQHDWLICHVAALTYCDRAYAFAGFSGGGKSTLMLQLLNASDTNYMTNDRLFIRQAENDIEAMGIPKSPRVNPGTIVHNDKLHPLLTAEQRQHFLSMPTDKLRELEQKYDVDIQQLYGKHRISLSAPLQGLVILNWRHDSSTPLQLQKIKLASRKELLDAVMKSPGPFYQYPNGRFYQERTTLPAQAYMDRLKDIDVYEVSGRADFEKLADLCRESLFG